MNVGKSLGEMVGMLVKSESSGLPPTMFLLAPGGDTRSQTAMGRQANGLSPM
jgi:hypothetical protein